MAKLKIKSVDLTKNPFREALTGGVEAPELIKLAVIVTCAQVESDVWAGCRVERALSGKTRNLSGYLQGKYFAQWASDDLEIAYLDILRDMAHEFIAESA